MDTFVVPMDPLTRLVDHVAQILSLRSSHYLKISKNLRYGDLWLSPPQYDYEAPESHQLIQCTKRDCIPQQIFLNRSFLLQLLLPELIPDGAHILPWSSYVKFQKECSSCTVCCVVQEEDFDPSQLRSLLFASCAYSILLQAGVCVDFLIYMTPVEAATHATEPSPFSGYFRSLQKALLQQATAVYREPLESSSLLELVNRCYDSERQMFCLSLLSEYTLPTWCYPLQDWYVPKNSHRYRVFCYLHHLLTRQVDAGEGILLLFTSPQQIHLMKKSMQAAALCQSLPHNLLDRVKWIPCGVTHNHLHECVHSHIGNETTFVPARCVYSLWGGKVSHPTHLFCPVHHHPTLIDSNPALAVDKWLYQYARMTALIQYIPQQQQQCYSNLSLVHPIEWNLFYGSVLTYYRILPSLCQDLLNTCCTTTPFHLLTEWLAKTTSNFTQLYSQLRIVTDKSILPHPLFFVNL
ncbi:hypothetical protein GpartN1_g4409.t1 [Galdieria partita]|uniref:Uncharacterized protein n=1 Tax=Galdieria partita TaxID=83374 RepID=A0A9C7PXL1_9RHOD|nr:hypothetical protein GpartN1_g4409.t1 [Galdieria partita]